MSESDQPQATHTVGTRQFLLVAACFMLSGFAALLYETVWLRQFAIILGTSEQALAVILGSYMGGLALGSAIAARVVDRVTRPLLTYGLLEAGIALSALSVPIGLMVVRYLQSAIFGGSSEPRDAGSLGQVLFALLSTFSLILVPTTMMGATLPLLTKHVVHRNDQLGWQIALLYAINTAGAVIGTLTAAMVCLPSIGLSKTVWVGVAANMLVFALVWLMSGTMTSDLASDRARQGKRARMVKGNEAKKRRGEKQKRRKDEYPLAPDPSAGSQQLSPLAPQRVVSDLVAAGNAPSPGPESPTSPNGRGDDADRYDLILWLIFFSGAISFCYEIVFTRMLGHLLGGSIFAFATMLAGFLLGITIGSTLAARLCRTRVMAATGFVYAQCGAAICSLFAYRGIDWMASWPPGDDFGGTSLGSYVTTSILALTPTAICIGATFPLAIRTFARDETDAAQASAKVYLWNTVGAIIGAIVTGAWLLPTLQYEGTALIAILANVVLGIATVLLVLEKDIRHLAITAAVLVGAIAMRPQFPENVLYRSGLAGHPIKGDLIYTQVGRSATVALFDQLGSIQVRTNGLPEATVVPKGNRRATQGSAVWLSALPVLVRPDCESMLIVGLGGGIAAANVPPSVSQVDVFELEPAVVEANRLIGPSRDWDPMIDSRVRIILNDGRNGLHLTTKKYDAIVSQPSHPWTAGASHLFTREFASIASDHLTDDGVFLQWMASEFVDVPLLRSMTATLLDVFPSVRLYSLTEGELLFVGSKASIEPERLTDPVQFIAQPNRDHFRSLGMRTPSDLFAALRLDLDAAKRFAVGAPLITDDNNLFAVSRSASRSKAQKEIVHQTLSGMRPIMRSKEASRKLCPTLDLPSLLQLRAWDFTPAETATLIARIDDPLDRLLREANDAKSNGNDELWARKLSEACNSYPDDSRAAFILLSDHLMASQYPLSEAEIGILMRLLDDRHRQLVEAITANRYDRFDVIRQHDELYRTVAPGDPEFPFTCVLQSYWRIMMPGPDQAERARDAIDLIELNAPYMNAFAMSWLRTRAGIIADHPRVALATVQDLAMEITDTIESNDPLKRLNLPRMVSTLQKCLKEIDDPSPFAGEMEKRYFDVRKYANDVLLREWKLSMGDEEVADG